MKPKKIKQQKNELLEMLNKAPKQPKRPMKRSNPVAILFVVAILLSFVYVIFSSGTKEIVNDKIGINEVVGQYLSGSYTEIIVEGETLKAKKPEVQETIGSKTVPVVHVDKVRMPPKDSLKDLGFNVPGISTKITVKEDFWGNFLSELLPTLL